VNKLLVTGGFTRDYISEARMMTIALVTYGVPPGDIVEDELASSTVENGLFAARLFDERGWPKTATLVSQKFHLPRAGGVFKQNGFQVQDAPSADAAAQAARCGGALPQEDRAHDRALQRPVHARAREPGPDDEDRARLARRSGGEPEGRRARGVSTAEGPGCSLPGQVRDGGDDGRGRGVARAGRGAEVEGGVRRLTGRPSARPAGYCCPVKG
jgi:hypothetical protein